MQNTGIVGLLFSYQGRINRGKYWLAAAIYFAIMVLMMAVAFIMFGNSLLSIAEDAEEGVIVGLISKGIGFVLLTIVVYIPMLVSGVFVGIKRLHDREKSGWWLLVFYLLPLVLSSLGDSVILMLASFAVSIWGFVELGCLRGTTGPNKYGPDPLSN